MKDRLNKSDINAGLDMVKAKYQSPVLRNFGLVIELTNQGLSFCMSDGVSCSPTDTNMGMDDPMA